jgi:hypothetical protein
MAWGVVNLDGSIAGSGTGNWTSTWFPGICSTCSRYHIDFQGPINYVWVQDAALVTLQESVTAAPACNTAHIRTDSVSGNLLVTIYDAGGAKIQCQFSFLAFDA